MLLYSLVTLFLLLQLDVVISKKASLVITMMCRDEEVNIKANLEAWTAIADYYVFLIDKRTKDNTKEAIQFILDKYRKEYSIIDYEFDGFGQARTLSLGEAWQSFPQASHVLVADPDWFPLVETMNLNDLDDTVDVFRFTAYDRNGITRRRMDWLMRHRAGLAMRYSLHEVLDIGMYSIKDIGWTVREIERPGTWHATVGHAHSMSAARYEFDLKMLMKDVDLYGHDPHVHYYLGITYQAYAEKLEKQQGGCSHGDCSNTDKILESAWNSAIHYLYLRATANYKDEFIEERWASMYMLGGIYGFRRKDYPNGAFWWSMCRDYNPNFTECGLALTKLNLIWGQLQSAMQELHKILQVQHNDRPMLTHFKHWQCEIPYVFTMIYSNKARLAGAGILTTEEAMYMVLMARMTEHEYCDESTKVAYDITAERSIAAALQQQQLQSLSSSSGGLSASFTSSGVRTLSLDSSIDELCANQQLKQYLSGNDYHIHPCEDLRQQMLISKLCQPFITELPSAHEELQANSFAKKYVGAASMPDIIHHVYNGDKSAVYRSNGSFKMLFAEYFDPVMVYNLIGGFERSNYHSYEVTVVSSSEQLIKEMQETIETCSSVIPLDFRTRKPRVKYLIMGLQQFLDNRKGNIDSQYDYIEYNGGISIADTEESAKNHLKGFSSILGDTGVLGFTYFASNQHVEAVHKLLRNRNVTFFPPFSLEPKRIVQQYLRAHGKETLLDDQQVMILLGAEPAQRFNPPQHVEDMLPSLDWRTYTQHEIDKFLEMSLNNEWRTVSRIPTGYSNPYTEFPQYSVQSFWAMGLSQQDLLHYFMSNFRYAMYLCKAADGSKKNSGDFIVGRPRVSIDIFQPPALRPLNSPIGFSIRSNLLAKDVFIIDRFGSLSNSFSGISQSAAIGGSTAIAFAHYDLKGAVQLPFLLDSSIAPSLALLSSNATLQDLHDTNVAFAHTVINEQKRQGLEVNGFDEVALQQRLLDTLNYLERLNAIVFMNSKVGGINTASTTNVSMKDTAASFLDGNDLTCIEKTSHNGSKNVPITEGQRLSKSERMKRMRMMGLDDELIAEVAEEEFDYEERYMEETEEDSTSAVDPPGANVNTDSSSVKKGSNIGLGFLHAGVGKNKQMSGLVRLQQDQQKRDKDEDMLLLNDDTDGDQTIDNSLSGFTDDAVVQKDRQEKIRGNSIEKLKKIAASKNLFAGGAASTMFESTSRNTAISILKSSQDASKVTIDPNDASTKIMASEEALKRSKEAVDRVKVAMPRLLNETQVISSYRSLYCINMNDDQARAAGMKCSQTMPLKRKTSHLSSTSLRKIAFDVSQLQYLLSTNVIDEARFLYEASTFHVLAEVVQNYIAISKFIQEQEQSAPTGESFAYKVLRLSNSKNKSIKAKSLMYLNRIIHLQSELLLPSQYSGVAPPESLLHNGVVRYMQSIVSSEGLLQHDYLVIDVVLRSEALEASAKALLQSTIWFDITNGAAFVAHPDDGLIQPSFLSIAQQLAWALSPSASRNADRGSPHSDEHGLLQVEKYYAVAMNTLEDGYGPVTMANPNEIALIIWLSSPSEDTEENDRSDGLLIYDDYSAGRLFSQGISVYPSVHPDFLSRSGSLDINLFERCAGTENSVFIPRSSNRMVIIQSRKPFTFVTSAKSDSDAIDFEDSTMVALVVVLSGVDN